MAIGLTTKFSNNQRAIVLPEQPYKTIRELKWELP